MTDTDEPAFIELLTDALAFYGQAPSPFALSVWWQACERFDLQQVARALTAHAMDPERGQFAPRPADLVRVLHGTHGDRALIAWGRVYRAIGTQGAYTSVVFDEPAIHAAVQDLGGWVTVCRSTVDELPFLQRRFCDAYRAYSARGCAVWPAVLIGEHEAANRLQGRTVRPPALLGDEAACRRVLAGPDERLQVAASAGRAPRQLEVAA